MLVPPGHRLGYPLHTLLRLQHLPRGKPLLSASIQPEPHQPRRRFRLGHRYLELLPVRRMPGHEPCGRTCRDAGISATMLPTCRIVEAVAPPPASPWKEFDPKRYHGLPVTTPGPNGLLVSHVSCRAEQRGAIRCSRFWKTTNNGHPADVYSANECGTVIPECPETLDQRQ